VGVGGGAAQGKTVRNNSVTGSALPSPRLISNTLFGRHSPLKSTRQASDLHTWWGLLLVGDCSKAGVFNPAAQKIPMAVPAGDPWFDPTS
jgi:hypothetical protein